MPAQPLLLEIGERLRLSRNTVKTQAAATFEEGTGARETADRYVRVTVLFALVLFLMAVMSRKRRRSGYHVPAQAKPAALTGAFGGLLAHPCPWRAR